MFLVYFVVPIKAARYNNIPVRGDLTRFRVSFSARCVATLSAILASLSLSHTHTHKHTHRDGVSQNRPRGCLSLAHSFSLFLSLSLSLSPLSPLSLHPPRVSRKKHSRQSCSSLHGGPRTFHQKSTCFEAINFIGPYKVTLPPRIWGRRNLGGSLGPAGGALVARRRVGPLVETLLPLAEDRPRASTGA